MRWLLVTTKCKCHYYSLGYVLPAGYCCSPASRLSGTADGFAPLAACSPVCKLWEGALREKVSRAVVDLSPVKEMCDIFINRILPPRPIRQSWAMAMAYIVWGIFCFP